MSKKVVFILLFILITLGYIFKIDILLINKINIFNAYIKSSYILYTSKSANFVTRYFSQINTIETLQEKVDSNENYKILYELNQAELNTIKSEIFLDTVDNNLSVKYISVLSYVQLNDFSKVILNTKANKEIRALVTPEGYSAGIVLEQNNQAIAYLNSNARCNYAVYIGENSASGITSGTDLNGDIIIKHIPKWKYINIGDKVTTSGIDNIFPQGIKVGIVTSIRNLVDTKVVTVKPYKDVMAKKHFYIINHQQSIP
jgi:rod shape-determining protein MreC